MIKSIQVSFTLWEGGPTSNKVTLYNARETAYWEKERQSLGLSREDYLKSFETRLRDGLGTVHSLVILTD